jgi:VWFA-related protein
MRPTVIVLLVSILATGAPQAQPPRGGAPAQNPPAANEPVKFSSLAQLVEEMVSVKDKSGKVIEGLTAKDFVVTEDGKPQDIKFCYFQKLDEPEDPDPAAAAAPDAVKPSAPELKKTPIQSVTKSEIAAEAPGDLRYKNRRLLVLYFDMSSMPIPDQLRALDSARKFILKQMTKADLLAMMEYASGSVKVLQDFTDDKDALMQQIETLIVGEDQGFGDSPNDAASADTGAAFGQDDSEFNLFNTDRQLAALQTAVNMLAHLNEKKSLIYFASGITLQGVDNQAQMRSTTNAAARANVTLYPVDARGLVAMAPLGNATQANPGGVGAYSGNGAMAMMTRLQRSQDTMYSLAADTGGKALFDVNDLSLGIVNAQKAYNSYYIIGYYSTNANLDGKFRRINISLKEITANLDYRKGYFAGKVFGKFTTADKERQLEDALMMGDPITDLTIQMEVNYFQLNRAEYYVPLVMKIPGRELALARRGGAERTVIDFIGEIKDEYGATIQNIRDKVDMKLSGATAAQWAKVPIQYVAGYTLLPGTYSIKVLARDDETGRIGTYMNKFVVPNLNKEDKRIPISSVVLSSQRMDMRDALYTAGKDKVEAVNPLVQDGMKLIPSVTRVFSKSKDMYIYLQAYERAATTSTQPLVAFVTFYRGQTKAFETPPLPVTDGMDAKSKAVPLRFAIALDKLQAGQYDCQVSVVDPTNQKVNFWQSQVMLVP